MRAEFQIKLVVPAIRNELAKAVLKQKMLPIDKTRVPIPADRQTVLELFYAIPMIERGRPLMAEIMWVLHGRPELERHEKILPDYCYHIFDVFKKTYFKGLPSLSDSVSVTDQNRLATAQTIAEAKQALNVDWVSMGKMFGIGMRCLRFAELEAGDNLNQEGFGDLSTEKAKEICTVIMGHPWVADNWARIENESEDQIFTGLLNQSIESGVKSLQALQPRMEGYAYQWSPAAMSEFAQGLAEGTVNFMDADGQLVGESQRSGIYVFLLLVWPEIKVMLESSPRRTLRDLHEWMEPFMRWGLTAYVDIDYVRDVCAPPPSGIGLILRPLKTAASA